METVQLVLREVKRGEISLAEQAPVLVAIIGRLTDPVELREVKSFLRARALVEFVARRLRTSVAEHNAQLKLDMRTEHRLGEVLRDMVRRRGRYSSDRGRLPEEITPYESSLCQRIALKGVMTQLVVPARCLDYLQGIRRCHQNLRQ